MPLDYSLNRPPLAEVRRLAERLLDRVGLADRLDHEPSQMSGGQQQRVAIARLLVNQPSLLLADEPTGNLDSHTSVEILEMFQRLNDEGISVILVTHDPNVAAYAHRIIRISDGRIEGDERPNAESPASHPRLESASRLDGHLSPVPQNHLPAAAAGRGGNGNGAGLAGKSVSSSGSMLAIKPAPAHPAAKSAKPQTVAVAQAAGQELLPSPAVGEGSGVRADSLYGDALPKKRSRLGALPMMQTFRTAMNALYRNKMRSALTALGVIIGVAAVIAMTEIGEGSKVAIQKTIASMGANNLIVLPGAATSSGISWGAGSVNTLTPQNAEKIAQQCPAVAAAAPLVRARSQVVYGNRNWNTNAITGTTPSYLVVRDWEGMDGQGDVLSDRDVRNRSKVCMIGVSLKKELFQDESPIGKDIRIQNVSFRVIGVLSKKGRT